VTERFERKLWEDAFASFVASPGKWDWLVDWVRASSCLPVYVDWTHALGVNEHGEIVSHQHEEWPGQAPEVDRVVVDPRILNLAVHQGRERYPWLIGLALPRPPDAQTCSLCNGTGTVPLPVICYGGGSGWVPASDTWVNNERLQAR
jgi:hypothetical protein